MCHGLARLAALLLLVGDGLPPRVDELDRVALQFVGRRLEVLRPEPDARLTGEAPGRE